MNVKNNPLSSDVGLRGACMLAAKLMEAVFTVTGRLSCVPLRNREPKKGIRGEAGVALSDCKPALNKGEYSANMGMVVMLLCPHQPVVIVGTPVMEMGEMNERR